MLHVAPMYGQSGTFSTCQIQDLLWPVRTMPHAMPSPAGPGSMLFIRSVGPDEFETPDLDDLINVLVIGYPCWSNNRFFFFFLFASFLFDLLHHFFFSFQGKGKAESLASYPLSFNYSYFPLSLYFPCCLALHLFQHSHRRGQNFLLPNFATKS